MNSITLLFAHFVAFSNLREFRVGMTMAHQYMAQLDPDIKSAVLGNAGTIISFRIGTEDAMHMAKEMYPEFDIEDFINLPNYKNLFETYDRWEAE